MIELIIHIHDRSKFVERALEAATRSIVPGQSIVTLSFNGANIQVKEYLAQLALRFHVSLRVRPNLGVGAHFRQSMLESTAEFVVLLHDDDVVTPRFVSALLDAIKAYPGVGCLAPDYCIDFHGRLRGGRVSNARPFRASKLALAVLYLAHRCGPVFPSVCYKRGLGADLFAQQWKYGKYSDVVILLKAAETGLLVLPEKRFVYVQHGGNDSYSEDVHMRRRLRRYLLETICRSAVEWASYRDCLQNIIYVLSRIVRRSYRWVELE